MFFSLKDIGFHQAIRDLCLLGLLIFGKRLPEVGRSVGKTIVEFKKGMREVESEIHQIDTTPTTPSRPALQEGYKFDPYTGKPISEQAPASTEPRQ